MYDYLNPEQRQMRILQAAQTPFAPGYRNADGNLTGTVGGLRAAQLEAMGQQRLMDLLTATGSSPQQIAQQKLQGLALSNAQKQQEIQAQQLDKAKRMHADYTPASGGATRSTRSSGGQAGQAAYASGTNAQNASPAYLQALGFDPGMALTNPGMVNGRRVAAPTAGNYFAVNSLAGALGLDAMNMTPEQFNSAIQSYQDKKFLDQMALNQSKLSQGKTSQVATKPDAKVESYNRQQRKDWESSQRAAEALKGTPVRRKEKSGAVKEYFFLGGRLRPRDEVEAMASQALDNPYPDIPMGRPIPTGHPAGQFTPEQQLYQNANLPGIAGQAADAIGQGFDGTMPATAPQPQPQAPAPQMQPQQMQQMGGWERLDPRQQDATAQAMLQAINNPQTPETERAQLKQLLAQLQAQRSKPLLSSNLGGH